MACEVQGIHIGSRPVSIPNGGGGGALSIPLDFLDQAIAGMSAPAIDELVLRVAATVTTVNGGGAAKPDLFPQMIGRFELNDQFGNRVSLEGASIRIMEQQEYGLSYSDVTNNRVGNLGNNASQAVILEIRFPCRPTKCADEAARENRIPAKQLRDGACFYSPATAPIGPAAGNQILSWTLATVELWATVVDEIEVKKEKVRWVIRDFPINNQDDMYPIAGRIAWAVAFFGAGNENPVAGVNAWPAQLVDSRTIGMAQVRDDFLLELYKERSLVRPIDAAATGSALEDEVLRQLCTAIVSSRPEQSILEMPATARMLHYRTNQAFGAGNFTAANAPRIIAKWYEQRPAGSCRVPGATLGAVVGYDGRKYDPAALPDPALANILPREIISTPTNLTRR